MRDFYELVGAVDFIEDNLCEKFTLDDVARHCYCSLSSLHRTFRYVFGYSLNEYVRKRRMTKAAEEMQSGDMTITDLAYKYGYGSPEAFTRAFSATFYTPPSRFRRNHSFSQLFPRLNVNFKQGGIPMKDINISNFYEEIKGLRGTYVLCTDIVSFKSVNDNYGYDVGDIMLVENAKRLEACIGEDMTLFRSGRDNFTVLTRLSELDKVNMLADRICTLNGNRIEANEHSLELSLRVGITKIPEEKLDLKELLSTFDEAHELCRKNGKYICVI